MLNTFDFGNKFTGTHHTGTEHFWSVDLVNLFCDIIYFKFCTLLGCNKQDKVTNF
jgi:hypothetical protein